MSKEDNSCLWPVDNDTCGEEAFCLVTRVKDNQPNITIPVCLNHLNEALPDSYKVKEEY